MRILLALVTLFFAPLNAFAIHLGLGLGAAFNPTTFYVATQNTKSFYSYFANVPDVAVTRVFELKGPFYTAIGGHAGLGYNLLTIGPAVATGIKFDLWLLRISAEYYFLIGHRGQMDGNAVIEIGAGWK